MNLRRWLCALVLTVSLPAGAQPLAPFTVPVPAEAPAPMISLVTFAPGEIYWQRFGHNALLVREPGARARLYNYGIFDFRQKNFFLNFARGHMQYRLDEAPLDWALQPYVEEGRWALEQRLALSDEQARATAAFLAWNAQPQHAEYRYDYFLSNCSTKTRDVIDVALGGRLRLQLESRTGAASFRSEVLRLMAPVPALMIGMDLGLGPRVDAPLNAWQDAFIPLRLMESLRSVQVGSREDGTSRPLVASEGWLLPPTARHEPAASPLAWPTFLVAGLALAALLTVLRTRRDRGAARTLLAVLVAIHATVCGLAGVVLLLGWSATEHWGMAANRNLLLLHPLWLLLLPALVRRARGSDAPAGIAIRGIATAALAAALFALPLAMFGAQPNLHWVALLLPAQLILLAPLRRNPAARR
jgi:hypothetical protein